MEKRKKSKFLPTGSDPRTFYPKNLSRTLDKLFEEIININGVHNSLDMNEASVRVLRKKCNDGTPISVEKMHEILEKAGYKMGQEER